MYSLTCTPLSSSSYSHHTTLKPNLNPLLGADATSRPCSLPLKRRTCFTTKAILSSTREDVLKHFNERRALKGGATLLDIACDPELVNLAIDLTSCPYAVRDKIIHPIKVEVRRSLNFSGK
ncbi:hypothetical protein AAZX31_10G065800 [Glycine max]|uniref:uncharacterized protein n=1 Tax=Glycine max TaxID=3847 RepID=UPI00023C8901|nr:uncharacterized protein LOC106794880 [Glycine max]